MRILPSLVSCLSLQLISGCKGSEPEKPYDPYEISDEERAANIAAYNAEQARFAVLPYPDCDQTWKYGQITECGVRRFVFSMEYCDKVGGSSNRLNPLSAGDSWISRAGKENMLPFEGRAKRLEEGGLISEGIAYAEGDGTNRIKIVTCQLNSKTLQVEGIYKSFR